jgi:hypothetical protein
VIPVKVVPNDSGGDNVLLGLGTGLNLLYLQGTLERALRRTALSYLFWIVAGLIATLSRAQVTGKPPIARGARA